MLRCIVVLWLCLPAFAFALQIEVRGVTAISAAEIDTILLPYKGRVIEVEDVVEVADIINRRYEELGYVTSGVVLPTEPIGDLIILRAVEGSLDEIRIVDSGRLAPAYVQKRLSRFVEAPFNVKDVQLAFGVMEREPAIAALRGELVPGAGRGQAALELTALEAPAFHMAFGVNNYASPSVGADQLELELSHLNLTGHSDQLDFVVRDGEGLTSGSLRYQFPFVSLNAKATVSYSLGDSLVVEAPFEPLDIRSETDTLRAALVFTFFEHLRGAIEVGFGIEKKSSETWLLDLPFDFSPGSRDGKSDASIAEVFARYGLRDASQALVTQLTWRRGLDIWAATDLPGAAPDGEFDAWRWHIGYARRLSLAERSLNLRLRARGQVTGDTLQSFERVALGGHASVRGFRENQVLMDEGWELRAQLDTAIGDYLMVYPFFDAGHGQNSGALLNVRNEVDLRSVGFGVRATVGGFSMLVEWANRLSEEQEIDNTLQDKGFHAGLRYERAF